jgi:hypothetical protein
MAPSEGGGRGSNPRYLTWFCWLYLHQTTSLNGVWGSLVAYLIWIQDVAGSNPASPTME